MFPQVRVQVTLDDDLDLVETNLPPSRLVSVESGSGTPFTMKLRPRSVELMPVTCAFMYMFEPHTILKTCTNYVKEEKELWQVTGIYFVTQFCLLNTSLD